MRKKKHWVEYPEDTELSDKEIDELEMCFAYRHILQKNHEIFSKMRDDMWHLFPEGTKEKLKELSKTFKEILNEFNEFQKKY